MDLDAVVHDPWFIAYAPAGLVLLVLVAWVVTRD